MKRKVSYNSRRTKKARLEIVDMALKAFNLDGIKRSHKTTYLGCILSSDPDAGAVLALDDRIEKAKVAFASLRKILTSEEVELRTRQRLVESIVWNTLLYGLVAFELTLENEKKLFRQVSIFEACIRNLNRWRLPTNRSSITTDHTPAPIPD